MNEGIAKVLATLFPKINQFTCEKMFIPFTQMGLCP